MEELQDFVRNSGSINTAQGSHNGNNDATDGENGEQNTVEDC